MQTAYLVGNLLGALIWCPLLAALFHVCTLMVRNPDERAGWFIGIVFAFLGLSIVSTGEWLPQVFQVPPALLTWWLYRRWLRTRLVAE